MPCPSCCTNQINLALVVASTSMVPDKMRARLGGLFNMAESVGRFLGPAGYATIFAWSVSPSAYDWVGHRFVFYMSAIAIVVVTAVGWKSLALDRLVVPKDDDDTGVRGTAVDNEQCSSASLSPAHRAGGKEADLV